jgi:hypothetical protein
MTDNSCIAFVKSIYSLSFIKCVVVDPGANHYDDNQRWYSLRRRGGLRSEAGRSAT